MTLPNQLVNNTIADAEEVMANFDNLDGRLEDIEQEWQDWTPTWTNLTVGNGTTTAKYTQIGKTVHYYIKFTLGSTSAIGSPPKYTLPITPILSTIAVDPILGHCSLRDVTAGGAGSFVGYARAAGSGEAFIGVNILGAGNYINNVGLSATTPFTWATDDVIAIFGTYEAE